MRRVRVAGLACSAAVRWSSALFDGFESTAAAFASPASASAYAIWSALERVEWREFEVVYWIAAVSVIVVTSSVSSVKTRLKPPSSAEAQPAHVRVLFRSTMLSCRVYEEIVFDPGDVDRQRHGQVGEARDVFCAV